MQNTWQQRGWSTPCVTFGLLLQSVEVLGKTEDPNDGLYVTGMTLPKFLFAVDPVCAKEAQHSLRHRSLHLARWMSLWVTPFDDHTEYCWVASFLSYQKGQCQFTTLCCKHYLSLNTSLQSSTGTMTLWDLNFVPLTIRYDSVGHSAASLQSCCSHSKIQQCPVKYTGDRFGVLDISCYGWSINVKMHFALGSWTGQEGIPGEKGSLLYRLKHDCTPEKSAWTPIPSEGNPLWRDWNTHFFHISSNKS